MHLEKKKNFSCSSFTVNAPRTKSIEEPDNAVVKILDASYKIYPTTTTSKIWPLRDTLANQSMMVK